MVFYKVFVIVSSSLWWIQGMKIQTPTSKYLRSWNLHPKQFNRIWFFLRSGLPWIIWRQQNDLVFNNLLCPIEKTRQIIWDPWQDYGRIGWKQTLKDLEEAPDVAYQDVLNELDSMWGVKNLIVTRSNLVVNWMDRPHMRAHYLLIPLELR